MKILQIVHGFPPESNAGTESYCEALSRCLLMRGHECLVFAGSTRFAPDATLTTVEQDGLLVTRYLSTDRPARRWTDEYDHDAETLVRRLLILVHPDVVHLHHWLHLTNNLVAICTDLGIPVVVTLHDVWTSCPKIHRIRWDGAFCTEPPATAPCRTCAARGPWQGDEEISRALALRQEMMTTELALADAIIAPSAAHRTLLLSVLGLPQERVTILSHGNLSARMAEKEDGVQAASPTRPLQIGHWGYLMDVKGTHLILEAVRRLRDPSAVQVHLMGVTVEQEYEQRLRELAQGIPVQFHGAYQPRDLQTFDLDLAIFASITSESYSFALDEALCLRLPVLVSDRGACPERIGAAGLTFRAGDAADLARRLQEILDAPEMLDNMRRNIRPEMLFSMETHVAMLEKIYEDTAQTRKPKGESVTPYLKLIAHAKRQLQEREVALEASQTALAQSRRIFDDKEAYLQQALADKEAYLQQALADKEAYLQQALADKEAHLQQAAQALESLQEELASLRGTRLFKLHALLTKLSQR
ncbi:MAG: glycosyltransferase [Candidatus Methylomirabilis oxyfera]|nr:glycosyltransferase [Candidatus Methylomirabilis oxyfera]